MEVGDDVYAVGSGDGAGYCEAVLDGFAGWGHGVHDGDHGFSAGQEFEAGNSQDGEGGDGDYNFFLFWGLFLISG